MSFEPTFMAYAEHKEAIERFINELSQTCHPNSQEVQQVLAFAIGLNTDLLTSDEIEYIEKEVSRRIS